MSNRKPEQISELAALKVAHEISTVAKTLIEAKALIQDEENWCQGRATHGHKMCAGKALSSIGAWNPMEPHTPSSRALNNAACKLFPDLAYGRRMYPIVAVNDELGHAAVMKCFDLAIAAELEKSNG